MKILWEKSLQTVGNINGLFVPQVADLQFLEWLSTFENHKSIIIINKLWADALKSVVCQLLYFRLSFYSEDSMQVKLLSRIHIWDSPDPSAKMISKTVAFRQTLESTPFILNKLRRMRYIFQASLHHFIINHELQSDIPVGITSQHISWCKSDTLVMGAPKQNAFMVTNFSLLIQICSYLLIISSLALFIEILIDKWRDRRVIGRRNEEKIMNPKLQQRYYSI